MSTHLTNKNRPPYLRTAPIPRTADALMVLVAGDMICFVVKSENLMKRGLRSRLGYTAIHVAVVSLFVCLFVCVCVCGFVFVFVCLFVCFLFLFCFCFCFYVCLFVCFHGKLETDIQAFWNAWQFSGPKITHIFFILF